MLVSAALVLKLGWFDTLSLEHWVDFAALAMFVIGLSLAVFENASIDEDSRSRYEVYEQDLTDLMASERARVEHFDRLVRGTELLALREPADFCRAAERITYRV